MNHWLYKGQPVTCLEDIENHELIVGFVYKITGPDGRIYIGKKILHTSRKTKISKKEKLQTATRKKFKKVIKESNWKDYWGSSEALKKDLEQIGEQFFKREILEFACTKQYLSYAELRHQVLYDVLNTHSYNANILGRFFIKTMENCGFKLN